MPPKEKAKPSRFKLIKMPEHKKPAEGTKLDLPPVMKKNYGIHEDAEVTVMSTHFPKEYFIQVAVKSPAQTSGVEFRWFAISQLRAELAAAELPMPIEAPRAGC